MVLLLPQRHDEGRVRAREVAFGAERVRRVDQALPSTVCVRLSSGISIA